MLLDSAIQFLISALFTVMLLGASLHKFSDRLRFQGILAAYKLLPAASVAAVATAIPLVELVLGVAWMTGLQTGAVASATALLLLAYTTAIAINISRGNTAIDCGCGLRASKDSSFHRLSFGLVARNILLIALALLALLPANERALGTLDYLSIGMAGFGLVLLYGAYNQLLANKQLIDSWRKPLLQQGEDHA